jgi:hypothetical protein
MVIGSNFSSHTNVVRVCVRVCMFMLRVRASVLGKFFLLETFGNDVERALLHALIIYVYSFPCPIFCFALATIVRGVLDGQRTLY